jgi:hypothetical protein
MSSFISFYEIYFQKRKDFCLYLFNNMYIDFIIRLKETILCSLMNTNTTDPT